MVGGSPRAMAQEVPPQPGTDEAHHPICAMMEAVAQANALPLDFFVRLIWQESRFHPDEVGPLTRSGQRALGIAQFMPGTAVERQLFEPFNPAAALPKSGEFLAELRNEFGNLGLAAAAYNAGPQRVRDYLAHARELPLETRNYVRAITGRAVEEWAMPQDGSAAGKPNDGQATRTQASVNCRELLVQLEQTPSRALATRSTANQWLAQWQDRNVPSWCHALLHPDLSRCGPVHSRPAMTTALGQLKSRSHLHLIKASSR
jgi:Transglycosylase SLT domain